MKISSYSRQQMTRLIKQYHDTGYIRHHHVTAVGFKTKHKVSTIGERCKPNPEGRPGFVRIDTVHQGDKDK